MRVERQLWFWAAALVVLISAIALLSDILLPFVTAIVAAYFLNPIADRLERLGLKRLWAAILIVGVGAVLLALALVVLVPVLANQVRQLLTALPAETERFKALAERLGQDWLGPSFPSFQVALDRALTDLSQNWAPMVASLMASVWSRGLALVNFVSLLLITPVIVFYLLVDWHPILARLDEALPRDHAATIRRLAGDINDAVAAFIRGQGTICLMLGLFYAVGLSWAGIDYGLLVGLTTGLLAFIPIVGWVTGLIFASGLAIVQSWPDPTPLLKAVGVLVCGIAVDTAFLSPRFVGQKVGLHPVWMIFALFVFSYLFGIVGTLVAVPLAAAVGVLVRFALKLYLDSPLYKGNAVGGPASSLPAREPPSGSEGRP
ncbi:MAG TPA: AI-2E family transporter [Hyphomicrobiaceae bacterium]|nr:AI-2E family transporter [Hyphomicrobiaceae bacterium]